MNKVKPNTPEEIIELMQQVSENSLYKATCLTYFHSIILKNPVWNFGQFRYELVKNKPSIDWSHVKPEFKYMATDSDGISYFYTDKPALCNEYWYDNGSTHCEASAHSSYKAGTCDWKDSLVKRPDSEITEVGNMEEFIDILRRL